MTRIPFPSAPPHGPQTEVCALCQRLVNVEDLIIGEVDGLEGFPVCRFHGSLATEPSWLDLRGSDAALLEAAAAVQREEPFGDTVWWDADGFGAMLREDGSVMYREDVGGLFSTEGFLRES